MEPNQSIRNYPKCSIPYIDLKAEPERFDENEQNKIKFKWQKGDGWHKGYSSKALVDWTIEFIQNSPNPAEYKELKIALNDPLSKPVLCLAAEHHHPLLIERIVTVFGKHLLDVGDYDGNTPLMYPLHEYTQDKALLTVKTLLSLGADPNMINTDFISPLEFAVGRISVLEYKASKEEILLTANRIGYSYYELISLFRLHCSIDYFPFSKIHEVKLHTAKGLLFEELNVHLLFKGVFDSNSFLHALLPEIAREVVLKRIDLFKY